MGNPRVLVTGFGPFGSVRDNPSGTLALNSGGSPHVLEVSYRAAEIFVNSLDADSFDAWLMLGVAATRKQLSMELFARNRRVGADVRGCGFAGEIELGGPLLVGSTLWPLDDCCCLLLEHADILAPSMDAGGFLCNFLYYLGLRRFPGMAIGFLHVVMPEAVPLQAQARIVADVVEAI